MKRQYILHLFKHIIFICTLFLLYIYLPVVALPSQDGSQKKIVAIGSSMPITGPISTFAWSASEGIFAALHTFNTDCSEDIPYVREHIFDDMYIPYKTHENIKIFELEKIQVLLMPMGSLNIETYISDIREGKLLVLFPIMEGRYPDIKKLIHYRATYSEEVVTLIDYFSDFKRCAIFYQNDSFGIGPKDAAHKVLKEKNIEWVDVPYDRYEASFASAAEKIRTFSADAIIFICFPHAALGLIQELRPYTLINKKLFGVSDLLVSGFDEQMQKAGLNFTFAAITPNPFKSSVPIAQEYRKEMKKHGFGMDMLSFEGFITTQLFLESFKAAHYTIDQEKIIQYFENIHDSSFKGLPISFSKNRSLSKTVWIAENTKDDWKPFIIKS